MRIRQFCFHNYAIAWVTQGRGRKREEGRPYEDSQKEEGDFTIKHGSVIEFEQDAVRIQPEILLLTTVLISGKPKGKRGKQI